MAGLEKETTHVLLIGAANYPNWPKMNIPNVAVNVEELSSLLSNPDYCGIPSGQIKIVKDEDLENTSAVIYDFFDAIHTNKATVIIYYSGHGLQSTRAMDDLFLATKNIRENRFESSCMRISELRRLFSDCPAGRKILLLDCCYAGKITKGFLSDETSDSVAKLSEFEGTYIMAASSEYERARFDPDDPNSPTKFTGKFLDVVKNGVENDDEYCTLNSIYHQIRTSFMGQKDAPKPVQVGQNTVANLPIFKNKKYAERKPADEQAWEEALKINTAISYFKFKERFQNSRYVKEADKRIDDLDDDEAWETASIRDSIGGYNFYLKHYRFGKYKAHAKAKLSQLTEDIPSNSPIESQEEKDWRKATEANTISSYAKYLDEYPNGKYSLIAKEKRTVFIKISGIVQGARVSALKRESTVPVRTAIVPYKNPESKTIPKKAKSSLPANLVKPDKEEIKNLLVFVDVSLRKWKNRLEGMDWQVSGHLFIHSNSIEYQSDMIWENDTLTKADQMQKMIVTNIQDVVFQQANTEFIYNYLQINFMQNSMNETLLFYQISFWGGKTKEMYNAIAKLSQAGKLSFAKNLKIEP